MEGRTVQCPTCGAKMELKLQNFSIGRDGGGGLMSLLMEQYDVDLYACPQCGKVEMYTANFQQKADEPEEEPEKAEEAEPSEPKTSGGFLGFGRRKDKHPPWEK